VNKTEATIISSCPYWARNNFHQGLRHCEERSNHSAFRHCEERSNHSVFSSLRGTKQSPPSVRLLQDCRDTNPPHILRNDGRNGCHCFVLSLWQSSSKRPVFVLAENEAIIKKVFIIARNETISTKVFVIARNEAITQCFRHCEERSNLLRPSEIGSRLPRTTAINILRNDVQKARPLRLRVSMGGRVTGSAHYFLGLIIICAPCVPGSMIQGIPSPAGASGKPVLPDVA